MSLVLNDIKRRHAELVEVHKRGLAAQNASEHYEKDVKDLLRIADALIKTCAQLNMKWHEAAGKEPLEFPQYIKNFHQAVDDLISRPPVLKVVK